MSGDPLGNKLIIIIIILFRCVHFLCPQKYPGLRVCETNFYLSFPWGLALLFWEDTRIFVVNLIIDISLNLA